MNIRMMLSSLWALLLAACASSPTVHTDYDRQARFDGYHSYSWGMTPDAASPLMRQRILAGVDARLQAKGLQKLESGGDLVVAAHVSTAQKTTVDTMYTGTGMGGWGWRGGWGGGMAMGSSTTQVRQYDVGTLVVDLFDAGSKQALWRGIASGTVSSSPDKNAAAIDAGLDKMFASYPPVAGN